MILRDNSGRYVKGSQIWLGKNRSEITKKRLSLSIKKLWKNEDYKKYIVSSMIGKKVSKETIEKMRESHKGQVPWIKGKHHTKETRERVSKLLTGKNGPNWQGGRSLEKYGGEFTRLLREQIRERDCNSCQRCFTKQEVLFDSKNRRYKLIVHHIDTNKKNNDSKNLISLCRNCHMKTHGEIKNGINIYK